MTIKDLKKMLDNMSKKLPSGENTKIDFCHYYGFNKIQKGHLFNYYYRNENRIKFVSSYYYFEIRSSKLKNIQRHSTLEKAVNYAIDFLNLKDFFIMYTRGKTSSVEAVFKDGEEVSDKSWITE